MTAADSEAVLHEAEVVLANPFAPSTDRAAAEASVASSALASIKSLHEQGRDKGARRLAVALGLVEVSAGRKPAFLEERGTRAGLLSSIGLQAKAVAKTVSAAARCTHALRELAGVSKSAQELRASAWRACFGESVYEAIRLRPLIREQNVMILGETGTGKELLAQAIACAESTGPERQALNAAAIPHELLESELFGHVRGAFSGAGNDRQGKIAAAHGGTLFLDEIADLSPELQVKLLRVIEEGVLTPLGSNTPMKVDVRYICATSQALESLVDDGRFRLDLYQRLAGMTLEIPPLRERPEDIRPIAQRLFRRHANRLDSGSKNEGESTAHLSRLTLVEARFVAWLEGGGRDQPWKGNVRELQSLVRSWVLGFAPSTPSTSNASTTETASASAGIPPELTRFINCEGSLRELEDWYISHVVANVNYKQRQAARILDIDRGTLSRRLKQLDEN
jgi:transcriptional regulator with PAS, ATPase and Fis domain